MLEQITKYLSVSNPLPGPIMLSHQPMALVVLSSPAACASPEKAWRTRMALFLRAFKFAVGFISHVDGGNGRAAVQSDGIELDDFSFSDHRANVMPSAGSAEIFLQAIERRRARAKLLYRELWSKRRRWSCSFRAYRARIRRDTAGP